MSIHSASHFHLLSISCNTICPLFNPLYLGPAIQRPFMSDAATCFARITTHGTCSSASTMGTTPNLGWYWSLFRRWLPLNPRPFLVKLVGEVGFEPTTAFGMMVYQTIVLNQLHHSPIERRRSDLNTSSDASFLHTPQIVLELVGLRGLEPPRRSTTTSR